MAGEMLEKVDEATSCDRAAALSGTTSAWYALKAEKGAEAVKAAASALSKRFALLGGAFAVANTFGLC
jgi:hypothetical protein